MNATWTLNLFPKAWRRQYEPAFRPALAASTNASAIDLAGGAALAHLRPDPAWPTASAQPAQPHPAGQDPRTSSLWAVLLAAHVGLFTAVNAILLFINLLTTPDTLWFLYPLWGWGMVLAVHLGITWSRRSWLPAHTLLTGVVSAGLVGIDLATDGPAWSIWPVWAMASLLVVHALYASGRIGAFGAHVLATILGGIELAAVAIVAPDAMPGMVLAMGYWLVGLLVHALYRFGQPSLLRVHAVVFVSVNALLALSSLYDDEWWFIYPLVGWSVLLAAHAIVALAPRRFPSGTWEREMLAAVTAGNSPSPQNRRLQQRLHRRSFGGHLALFAIGTVMFGVLNLLSTTDTWWMVWPVSVWLVLLTAHLGTLLVPPAPAFGLALAGGAAAIAWLGVLDLATGGATTWWYWPAAVWALGVVVAFPLSFDLLRAVSDHAPKAEPGRR